MILASPWERGIWWGLVWLAVLAPLPLGSNRPWAWALLALMSFVIVATDVIANNGLVRSYRVAPQFFVATVCWMLFPLLQLVPLPRELVDVFTPGLVPLRASVDEGMAAISVDPFLTLEVGLRQAAALLVALVALRFLVDGMRLRQLVIALVILGSVEVVVGVPIFLAAKDSPDHSLKTVRALVGVSGSYVNKNHFAGLMELVLPLAVGLGLTAWDRSRTLVGEVSVWLGFGVLMLMGLVMSGSRGGLIGCAVGLLFAKIMCSPSIVVFGRYLLLATGIMFLGLGIVALSMGGSEIWDLYASKQITSQRPDQWRDTLSAIPGFLFFGSGLGTYDAVFPVFKSPELGWLRYDHAHNDFLEYLFTSGLVGVGSFLWVIASASLRLSTVPRSERSILRNPLRFAAVWACAAFMIHGLVDFNFQIPANFFLFFVLLASVAAIPGITDSRVSKR